MIFVFLAAVIIAYYLIRRWFHSQKISNYTDKYVFITGCDSGFGKTLTVRLDTMGFYVFAGCLTEKGRESLSSQCSQRVTPLIVDVTKMESILSTREEIEKQLPAGKGLWAVVSNAGVSGPGCVAELCTKEDYTNTLAVNLHGSIDVCTKFLPLIRKSRGRLVVMVSMAGRIAISNAPYAVSKFGMEAFVDVCRRELYSQGIYVSAIEPGFFKTDILNYDNFRRQVEKSFNQAEPAVKAVYGHDYVDKILQGASRLDEIANPNIHLVIDAYVDAITSKYPRPRYTMDRSALIFSWIAALLPESIVDYLVAKQLRQ